MKKVLLSTFISIPINLFFYQILPSSYYLFIIYQNLIITVLFILLLFCFVFVCFYFSFACTIVALVL